ncbi:MAG: hypothetical protein K0U98_00150 [Deltaproteobacteria bacterium]|nr:hypothetical protein [Deltaproteobacteria bacterium]
MNARDPKPRYEGYFCLGRILLLLCLCIPSSLLAQKIDPFPQEDTDVVAYSKMVGSVVATPRYFFDEVRDDLNEGAIEILGTNARNIKFYLDSPISFYPHKTDGWVGLDFAEDFPDTGLANLAKHPFFRQVFHRPFNVYVMTTPTLSLRDWWLESDGINAQEKAAMQREFYNLTKHFLTTYNGTGKTFVFSNWEGDNQLRRAGIPVPQYSIDNMVDWLQARQAGVNQARVEIPYPAMTDVRVLHSVEANDWNGIVVNDVIPLAGTDLVSYSAWGTTPEFINGDTQAIRDLTFPRFDNMVEELQPLHWTAPWNEAEDGKRLYLGEWGRREGSPDTQGVTILNSASATRAWGIPWLFYWTTYDNECNVTRATQNEQCVGLWLRRPEGGLSPAWHAIHDVLLEDANIDPPDDLEADFLDETRVGLSWSPNSADNARVQRQRNGAGWITLTTVSTNSYIDTTVQPGDRYRYRVKLLSGSLESGWFYTDTISQEVPFDALYSDMFRYSSKFREPFTPLQNDVTEVGGAQWIADVNVRWGENETVTNVPHSGPNFRGGIALNISSSTRVQADLDLSNANWAGLGFSSRLLDYYNVHGQVWVLLETTGRYFLRINGNNTLGPLGNAAIFDPSGFNRVELEYDPSANTASLWINGSLEIDQRSLGSFVPNIVQAGFHFNAPTTNVHDVVRLDNFAVTEGGGGQSLQMAQQPVAQAVSLGSPVTFAVAAAGGVTPYSYQWEFRSPTGAWGNISGATSASLTLGSVSASDEGYYRCRVGDADSPPGEVVSQGAFLDVVVQPSCPSGGQTLCLDDGRFHATLVWADPWSPPIGGNAFASLHPTADNAGFFYFDQSNSQNLEVGVKVLEGTNGHYWVYHGAMTTFDYTLTVVDTQTGAQKVYTKTGFDPCGGADDHAFPLSSLGGTPIGSTSLGSSSATSMAVAPRGVGTGGSGGTSSLGSCSPGSEHLCLLGGRFKVEVLQPATPTGLPEPQPATPVSDLSGAFHFFSPDNPEVFIKMLDPAPSIPWFWVFYGSMTDTDYEVRFTDTVTGAVRTYSPSAGLCGGADTGAFPKP